MGGVRWWVRLEMGPGVRVKVAVAVGGSMAMDSPVRWGTAMQEYQLVLGERAKGPSVGVEQLLEHRQLRNIRR